nr:hypothetical protein [Candidatus Baldrarchaeota archaeon]
MLRENSKKLRLCNCFSDETRNCRWPNNQLRLQKIRIAILTFFLFYSKLLLLTRGKYIFLFPLVSVLTMILLVCWLVPTFYDYQRRGKMKTAYLYVLYFLIISIPFTFLYLFTHR